MPKRLPPFEKLLHLARTDPDALEALRISMTQDVIRRASSPEARRRLEGLQCRIDLERRRAKSPLGATVRISELMVEALADLNRAFHQETAPAYGHEESDPPNDDARILPFPRV